MNFLFETPIGKMYGPFFLLFYFLVAVGVIVICKVKLSKIGSENTQGLPKIPKNPDPYEMAYLRGSENEVLRLAIFSLVQKGFLKVLEKHIIYQKIENANTLELNSIETVVYNYFKTAKKISETFKSEIKDQIKKHCIDFEDFVTKNNLTYNLEQKVQHNKIFYSGLSVILTLGIYKLAAAFYYGKHNVAFLIIEILVVTLTHIFLSGRKNLNKRGKEYLEKIGLIFDRLKRAKTSSTNDQDLLMLTSIFGFSVLAGTPYEDHKNIFFQSSTTGDSSGGCGSSGGGDGGGSCGGGCGGCGGGGD